jgi:hypothetical protein
MTKLKIPEPDLQISFFHRLQDIRHTHLLDGLLLTVSQLDITKIDQQLGDFVSGAGLQRLAGW